MKLAIMQPYFFPYIGYFQLINAVDEFVIYDNIQFTKKGWINRNRILVNGKDAVISIPLKNGSDFLNVSDRFLSETWPADRKKILNRVKESYRKAPFFDEVYPLFERCLNIEENKLFDFILYSLKEILNYLSIKTKVTISSSLEIDDQLKSQEKVLAICKNRNATMYINPVGGLDLYSKAKFESNGIKLEFLKSKDLKYTQFKNEFVSNLSILDMLMFNTSKEISVHLNNYNLI
jgi:hypothetical protein